MINTKKFDTYQMQEYNKAQALMDELKKAGIESQRLWIEQGDDSRADFRLILQDKEYNFRVNRDYHGNVNMHIYPYKYYSIDSYDRAKIAKEVYTSKNMKVITLKKLSEKIAEEVAYHEKMQALENDSKNAVQKFLDELSASGEEVVYHKNYEKTRITGGYITKNGLQYSFEISDSGYISQKISLHYDVKTTLETFKKLSDNKL